MVVDTGVSLLLADVSMFVSTQWWAMTETVA